MKGLLFGVFYASQGIYRLVGIIIAMPFIVIPPSYIHYYYVMNVFIGLAALLMYVWFAVRYRYRVRDEPCNVHQYAEEYYSKHQEERGFDFSRPVAAYIGQVRPWPYHIYGKLELENVQKWVWLLSLCSMAVPLPNCLLQSCSGIVSSDYD